MAQGAKHRHAAESGYQRGEETRARIIAAAMKLFGEQGFEGASTRDIAGSAGVNAPALQYYFDSKEGVYEACVEHIVSRTWEYMSDVISRAELALEGDADDETLIELYCAVQAQLAEFMFKAKDSNDWRLFMARLQAGMGPPAGFQTLYRLCSKRISLVTSTIVARLLRLSPGDEEVRIRALALHGPLMVFHVARRSVLTALSWDQIDAGRLELIKRIVREQTVMVLRSMIAARTSREASRPQHREISPVSQRNRQPRRKRAAG